MAERHPKFDKPPVVETALSVAFAPIENLVGARVGAFWANLREDFPVIAERPPYDMAVERLGGPPPLHALELKFVPAPSKTRFWLISEDDQRLIQVQRDWFAYNWRKRGEGKYVGYEEGRAKFREYFSLFESFLEDDSLGEIAPTQCEVTYVNHIERDTESGAFAEVFSFVAQPSLRAAASQVESWQSAMAVSLRVDDEQIGRLHFSVQPAVHEEKSIWVVNLTARGVPLGSGIDGVLEFLDHGRRAISLNFVEFTTEEMHKKWGLSWL